jgi:hypothetical protein
MSNNLPKSEDSHPQTGLQPKMQSAIPDDLAGKGTSFKEPSEPRLSDPKEISDSVPVLEQPTAVTNAEVVGKPEGL